MNNKVPSRQFYYAGALLLILGGLWLLAFMPRAQINEQMLAEMDTHGRAIEAVGRLGDTALAASADDLAGVEAGAALYRKRVARKQETDRVLQEVSLNAKNHKLKVLRIQGSQRVAPEAQTAGTPPKRFQQQIVLVELQGSFEAFYDFLLRLETMDQVLRVNQMTIGTSRSDDRIPEGIVQVMLELGVYFEREETSK